MWDSNTVGFPCDRASSPLLSSRVDQGLLHLVQNPRSRPKQYFICALCGGDGVGRLKVITMA